MARVRWLVILFAVVVVVIAYNNLKYIRRWFIRPRFKKPIAKDFVLPKGFTLPPFLPGTPPCVARWAWTCPAATTAEINRTATPEFSSSWTSDLTRPPSYASHPMAICLSGGLRTFAQIKEDIFTTLVKPNNADAFLYVSVAAPDVEPTKKLLSALSWVKAFQIEVHNEKLDKQIARLFCEPVSNTDRALPMFRKIFLCDSLVRRYEALHNIEYPVHVRSRPDLLLRDKRKANLRGCPHGRICVHRQEMGPSLDMWLDRFGCFPKCTAENRNSTPGCDYLLGTSTCCPYVTDFFAYGDRDVMHKYAQMYFTVNQFSPWGGGAHWPEHIAYQALQKLGVADALLTVDELGYQPELVRFTPGVKPRI